MTKEEAIALAESKFWESMPLREIATFQLYEEKLCMPFEIFHEALEKTLDRPVYTHEFTSSNIECLKKELRGDTPAPTIKDIINMIPADKRIIFITTEGGESQES